VFPGSVHPLMSESITQERGSSSGNGYRQSRREPALTLEDTGPKAGLAKVRAETRPRFALETSLYRPISLSRVTSFCCLAVGTSLGIVALPPPQELA
jgi:hypothetical protein